jgi:2-succinyl-5-enolpyruvyl-6-hydroxy-3-cyclohexene-1-carboxylate synthase
MGRNTSQNKSNQSGIKFMSDAIFQQVLEEVVKSGIKEFCICPGSRNSPLVNCIVQSPALIKYFWYEERSAAFFALGRARMTRQPVAIITTSGTAAGELLPAAMEAHYTGTPILLITADRPRRFRGTGAPQTAEQEGLFGIYAHFTQDIEAEEICRIQQWDQSGPAHLNVCIEEPKSYPAAYHDLSLYIPKQQRIQPFPSTPVNAEALTQFFKQSQRPLIIVSAIPKEFREAAVNFLLTLHAPIYCEGGSGLREDSRIKHLQIRAESAVWKLSNANSYPIDGVLRIGSVPVTRLWRDLEDRPNQLAECSISHLPFSGLSWGRHVQCRLDEFLSNYCLPKGWKCGDASAWLAEDKKRSAQIDQLFVSFPTSEPALYRELSQHISKEAMLFLGNSLPVREWDLAATTEQRGINIEASRGLNGIDGQLSTFLGLCKPGRENWTILGDLTCLYDFAALWILKSLPNVPIKIIIINNGGGKLFARIYKDPIFQHIHNYNFEHFAKSWGIPYFHFEGSIMKNSLPEQAFVEICPDAASTDAFWNAYDELK